MEYRNIHFQPQQSAPQEPCTEPAKVNLRKTTLSPAEEYQRRDGLVRPISDALVACIMSKKGFAEATRKGVTINRKELGGRRRFWHVDSPICNQLTGEKAEHRICYVYNSLNTDIIHLIDPTSGAYLESLPAWEKVNPLDPDAAKKVIAEQNRVIGRASARLQQLHGDDSRQAVNQAIKNGEAAQKALSILPVDGEEGPEPTTPSPADDVAIVEQAAQVGRQSIAKAAARDRSLEKALERKMTESKKTPPARQNSLPKPDPNFAFGESDSPATQRANQPADEVLVDPFDV